ncbi:MAG: hypothetical protein R6V53_07360, partial [Candidatus Woesearchaeota archaeon]
MRWIILLVLIATTNALDFTEATWDINLYGSTAKPVTSYIRLDNNPPSNQELTIGNIPYENGSYVLEGKNYDLSFTIRTREVPAKDKDSDPDSYLDNTYYVDTSGEIQGRVKKRQTGLRDLPQ